MKITKKNKPVGVSKRELARLEGIELLLCIEGTDKD
jgi:hypothetical protein